MATLDYLSGGRIICGIGVGGESTKDFESVQVALGERGARADEAITVLRKLWSGAPVSHTGRFAAFEDVALSPPPTQPGGPPIWVGGRSDAALRRAGILGDGWMAYMVSPSRFAAGIEAMRSNAAEAGKDAAGLAAAMMVPTRVDRNGTAARASLRQHLSRRYHFEFAPEQIDKLCLAGTPAEVHARVEEYIDAGVRHFIFLFGGAPSDAIDQFTLLYDEVVSEVAGRVSAGSGRG
jgi:alkanesulfonate monooxygenase SsuD/methylene tetrahydromethanopterin reductase-like flavin-dependent oxidoreductase (luciferase family)